MGHGPNIYRYAKRQARHAAGDYYTTRRHSSGKNNGSSNEWWMDAPNGRKCALCTKESNCTLNRRGKHLSCWERILTNAESERKSLDISAAKKKNEDERLIIQIVVTILSILVFVCIILNR